jgi:hypothetical protein
MTLPYRFGTGTPTLTGKQFHTQLQIDLDALSGGQTRTLEFYGAVGDGTTDDQDAIADAFSDAATNGYLLLGSSGKTYLLESGIAQSFGGVNFDGQGCTFKVSASATGFSTYFFDFRTTTTIASTTLNANTVVGDNSIVVTSGTNFTVGDLLVIAVTHATGGYFNGFASIVRTVAGTTITLQDRIPPGLDIDSALDTNSVRTYRPGRGVFKNAIFDGGTYASSFVALAITGLGGEVSGCQFIDCDGDQLNSGGLSIFNSVHLSVEDIYLARSGSALISDFQMWNSSSCICNDIRSQSAQGFGPQWFSGSLNAVSNVSSHGAGQAVNGRGILLQGECSSTFTNLVVTNSRDTGLSLTKRAQWNVLSGCLLVTQGDQAANTQALFTSSDSCNNNIFDRVITAGASAADAVIQINAADTGNVIGNLWVYPGIDKIVDAGGTAFGIVNGLPLDRPVTTTLANGDNNNVAIPAYSEVLRLNGPTGAFAITGFAVPSPVRDGQRLTVLNFTGFVLTIKNNTTSAAGNRILTGTGGDVVTGGNSTAQFIYDASAGFWLLLSHAP